MVFTADELRNLPARRGSIGIVGLRRAAREVSRMVQSFGARLREQRERKTISLIAISEQTKIKPSLLEALERDDVSHWPTGIFRRAFIRAYASAIELDPDVVVREFLEKYPDPDEAAAPVPAIEPGAVSANTPRPPMRVRFMMRSAMDSVSRKWVELAGRRAVPADREESASIVGRASVLPLRLPDPPLIAVAGAFRVADEPGSTNESQDPARLLQRAAGQLDAIGLVVWTWNPKEAELVPALTHGYSDERLARFPAVRPDADNATAAAFRSTQTCIVRGNGEESGAVVVPLMTPAGCVGVLAVELQRGAEQEEPVQTLAATLALQFAALLGAPRLPHAVGA